MGFLGLYLWPEALVAVEVRPLLVRGRHLHKHNPEVEVHDLLGRVQWDNRRPGEAMLRQSWNGSALLA